MRAVALWSGALLLLWMVWSSGCATRQQQGEMRPPVSPETEKKEAPDTSDTHPEKSAVPVDAASLILIPRPRQISATGRQVSPGSEVIRQINPEVAPKPQGYRLEIRQDGIRITGHDEAGIFYGEQTLNQIRRQCASCSTLPEMTIDDWPDFPHRGVMLDISRDKVPTMETLRMLVDMFAELKYNQLQLYMEHTFAYGGHETVWKNASPMTPEEIRQLDAWCQEKFIELVPNQNSFGHMERWLSHPEYARLAERPGSSDLCPVDPESIELLRDMYAQLLPNFSSGNFNVGCDETWSLGQGRSKEACERIGKGRVYLNFLKEIHTLVQAHNRTMMFWGDIILQHPELIPELPDDIIAMVWGYEADHPYAEQCPRFAASGIRFYVCPGTSSWNSLLGRTSNAMENLRNAARNGLAHGALGFLVTDWGDNGHWQCIPVSFAPFAYGAAVSWCYEANVGLDLARALDAHVFQDTSGSMGQAVLDLGDAHTLTGVKIGNSTVYYSFLLNALEGAPRKGALASLTPEKIDAALTALESGLSRIRASSMNRPDAALIQQEFAADCALARVALLLARHRLQNGCGTSQLPAGTKKEILAELDSAISSLQNVWLARNREGGLADSIERLKRLRDRLNR
ncbi:MAG TPA: family 20 glycosylhydrolase [Candidatus Hydrogenedentes bacterium]|nr:family 20 glycosylhydrolase [Candidatus Hydrogenedentota bacterium]